MNSALGETSKEPSSPTISTEKSFNDVINDETLNLNLSLSAIIENKWVNYIQTLPNQIQQKVLQKILEKVFITKKCTRCKISHTIENLNYQIKIFENCFQNMIFFSGSS